MAGCFLVKKMERKKKKKTEKRPEKRAEKIGNYMKRGEKKITKDLYSKSSYMSIDPSFMLPFLFFSSPFSPL